MVGQKRTIRLSQEDFEAFEMFFTLLKISGQRGKVFNAGLRHMAETIRAAMAESVAAYEIAAACASGEEWDELIEIIHPKYGDE